MTDERTNSLASAFAALDANDSHYIVKIVDLLIAHARHVRGSDLHVQPAEKRLNISVRIDGVLHPALELPSKIAPNVVARLKVMAQLLTYQTDVPQEGRIRQRDAPGEMRVSTFPTVFGERAVIRFFAGEKALRELPALGLHVDSLRQIETLLEKTAGAILFTGPAGSGKTTTLYACLHRLANGVPARSLVTLEDPVESIVPGVAQAEIRPATGFDFASGIRSLLRQDPDVMVVGEIRDRETAEAAFRAALAGHLLLLTFHAGSAAEALARLSEMGVEPYVLRSGVNGVVCLRLLRRLCGCAVVDAEASPTMRAVGCALCGTTGYRGRVPIAEVLTIDDPRIAETILNRSASAAIEQAALATGMIALCQRALDLVSAGTTTRAEVYRVLGSGEK